MFIFPQFDILKHVKPELSEVHDYWLMIIKTFNIFFYQLYRVISCGKAHKMRLGFLKHFS